MTTYTIECTDSATGLPKGTFHIVAPSAEEARDRVRRMGLEVVSIWPDEGPGGASARSDSPVAAPKQSPRR